MPSCLLVLALLFLALPTLSNAQALGDVAREVRAEKQESGSPEPRVITNADLVKSGESETAKEARTQRSAVDESAKPQSSVGEADKTAAGDAAKPVSGVRLKNDAAESQDAPELKAQQRTEEINQKYLDRIAALRGKINSAQQDLDKLQDSYQDRWIIPDRYPEPERSFRETQAMTFNQHLTELIEAQAKAVERLKSQMNDLKEEARHAGVPHATD